MLLKNVYGSKAAGHTWALYLRRGLLKRRFDKSNVDDCVYYYKGACILIYVDDTIITSPNKDLIKEILEALQRPSEEGADDAFDIEDEGDIDDFLGIKI